MNIFFGRVSKYFDDRGFGFVETVFPKNNKLFFHIKNIKKSKPEFEKKLITNDFKNDYFWFETEEVDSKSRLKRVITNDIILDDNYNNIIISLWEYPIHKNIESWLKDITITSLGMERFKSLETNRLLKIKQEQDLIEAEKQKKELENYNNKLSIIESYIGKVQSFHNPELLEKLKTFLLKTPYDLEEVIKECEFKILVNECSSKNFKNSYEVSNYIRSNKTGLKFQYISGIIKMGGSNSTWDFNGGISPEYYARLCTELNLNNKKSNSRVLSFKPYKNF